MEASRVPQSSLKLDMGRMFGGFGIVNPSSYLAQSDFSMMARRLNRTLSGFNIWTMSLCEHYVGH